MCSYERYTISNHYCLDEDEVYVFAGLMTDTCLALKSKTLFCDELINEPFALIHKLHI